MFTNLNVDFYLSITIAINLSCNPHNIMQIHNTFPPNNLRVIVILNHIICMTAISSNVQLKKLKWSKFSSNKLSN